LTYWNSICSNCGLARDGIESERCSNKNYKVNRSTVLSRF